MIYIDKYNFSLFFGFISMFFFLGLKITNLKWVSLKLLQMFKMIYILLYMRKYSSSVIKADLFYMKRVASWGQPCLDHMISWTCLQYLPYR